MALTMFDRARWTGKEQEADVFRHWLLERLREAEPVAGPLDGPKDKASLPGLSAQRKGTRGKPPPKG
jgi:hypothetical protein